MAVVVIAAFFFLAAFVLQLIIWHVRLPQKQTRALLLIYALTPIVIALVAVAPGFFSPLQLSTAEAVRIPILYGAVSLAYIALYSAIEMQSPTLLIVAHLDAYKERGCTETDLLVSLGGDIAPTNRFAAMERGGWIQIVDDVVEITPHGRFYGRLFEYAGRIFGLKAGG